MTDSNNNKCLPPSKNPPAKLGYLTISIEGLTFFSQNKQSYVIKLQFWGEEHPTYIPILSSETFVIAASLVNFKTYLIDCKVTQFEIVDNRNYKPIACAYLNWLPYLRALEDKQIYVDKQNNIRDKSSTKIYYLPFYDQSITENLPLYHYTAQTQAKTKNQQKIGELIVKWGCRVYQSEADANTASNINSGSNLYNIRVSEISCRKNDPVSICNIDYQEDPNMDLKTNKSIISKRPSNNNRLYATEHSHYPNARKSNVSILDNHPGHLKKVREEPEIDQSRTNIERPKGTNQLDLQLIRMRMEMEELVGPTNKKVDAVTLEILNFEATSKSFSSKDVGYCDVRCEGKDKNSHWRIFPDTTNQDKTYFNSTLSIKQGSLLTFIIGTKKGKDIFKGSMPIDCIRENYDVNIISATGAVVGYLRVRTQRKTELITPRPSQQKTSPMPQENKQIPNLIPIIPKPSLQSIKIRQNYKSQLPKQPQSYFIFVVQSLKKVKERNLSYKIFDMNIAQQNPQKIAFVSQSAFIGKPLHLVVYQNSSQIYQEVLINQLKPTPFASVNLTCSLVFEKLISHLSILCQLYAGNLQQINYLLQKMLQVEWKEEPPNAQSPLETNPIRTEESNKNSVIAHYELQSLKEEKRKMKTQIIGGEDRDRRLTQQKVSGESVAMDKFQMHSENQANEEENIYLVDLLTRFLDSLPENLLPETPELPKEKFMQILTTNLKSTVFQFQLIDIIISIFQDINSDNINIQQLIQCFKAYKSFYNIYLQQKQTVIKQILDAEPKAALRIRNNSQFGTVNDSMLWGRALSKVKDASIKQKLNKFYKISSFGTTDATLLLDDLQLKGKELRSLDISNLGMLIKEWVQEFITNAQLQKILNLKQKLLTAGEEDNFLNIRSVGDVIEMTLELRLSLWESLMLIEEIKGSYGCDIELQEGVISGASLLNWVDSVRKRCRLRSEHSQVSESQASLDPQQLALIKQINQQNKNQSEFKPRQSGHRSESRSMAAFNNDSDIVDIANLLREKDGLRPMELVDQINVKQVKSLSPKSRIIASQKIENELLEVVENKKQTNQIKEVPKIEKKSENASKYQDRAKQLEFYLQIKQFKLYNQKSYSRLIKALFLLETSNSQPTQEKFFYITSKHNFSEANQSIIKYNLHQKSIKPQYKGLKVILTDEESQPLYNGFLPIEQITDWISKNQADCKRTIVLYEPKAKIGGKLVISLSLNSEKYEKNKQNFNNTNISDTIHLTVNSIIPNLKDIKLFARCNQTDRKQIEIKDQLELQLKKPIYHCELIIGNEEESMTSIISLEQLYLKHYIKQSYPLVDANAGNFVATISITLTYNHKGIIPQILPQSDLQNNIEEILTKQCDRTEKRNLMSEIDSIYESLRLRYG